MRGFIITNLKKENIMERTRTIAAEMAKWGIQPVMDVSLKPLFEGINAEFLPKEAGLSSSDLILSVGGDGTLLHTAHEAVRYDLPVLGINAGRVGFLTALEEEEIASLGKLVSGEYLIENRLLIEAEADGNRFLAVNDIVLTRGANSRIVDVDILCEGDLLYAMRGDGVILSTPTGTTAYAMSAGGPVVDPAVSCISLTPICPYSLFSRSVLLSADRTITLRTKQINNDSDLMLSADGGEGIPISVGQTITVRASGKKLKLIRFSEKGFYRTLNQKLMLGGGYQ